MGWVSDFLDDPVGATMTVVGLATGQYWLAAAGIAHVQGDRAKKKAVQAFNDAQKDRTQMVRSATEPRRIVYGRARVSGPIVYAQSTGDKKQYLHLVVALAGHECDAIEEVWFNDVKLPAGDVGPADGWITSGDFSPQTTQTATATRVGNGVVTLPAAMTRVVGVTYATANVNPTQAGPSNLTANYTLTGTDVTVTGVPTGKTVTVRYEYSSPVLRVRLRHVLGTTTQAAFSELVAESGGKWTAAHQLKGICALYVRLEYDQDVFGQTGIPNISAVVRGKRIYDPRTGLTAWSANPALCAADYLKTPLGVTAAQIPDTELSAEANICDQLVAITAGGATQGRYTCNGVLSTESTPRDNLDAVLEAMSGRAIWVQGRWLLRAGAWRAPVMTITEDLLADGAVQINPDLQRQRQVNRIAPKYVEPGKTWTTVEAPPVTNSLYLADDGGIDLPTEITFDCCTDSVRAQRLSKIVLEQARQGMSVKINCSLRAYDLAPTDTVALTISRYGWSAKAFEVVERAYNVDAQQVSLTLRETASAVWDWAYGEATTMDLTPNTSLPSPFTPVAPLSGLTAASGTAQLQRMSDGSLITRALVSWTQSSDAFVTVGGTIEVQWAPADSVQWQQAGILPGDATSTLIGPLQDSGVIYIRARPVNAAGRAGLWATIGHVVVGKVAPPSTPTGVVATVVTGGVKVSWAACPDADYDISEIRIGAAWASATSLVLLSGNAWTWPWPAVGSYTIWLAHYDTSGNVSTPASVSVVVDASMQVQWGGVSGRPDSAGNLARKTSFEDGTAGTWSGTSVSAAASPGTAWSKQLIFRGRDCLEVGSDFPVTPGEKMYVSLDINTSACPNYNSNVGFLFNNSAGSPISWLGKTVAKGAPYQRVTGSVVVPAGAVTAVPWLQIDGPAGQTTDQLGAANLYFGRQEPGATVGAPAGTYVGSKLAETLVADAASALSTANAASTSASSALTQLTNLASDNILSPAEKPAVVQDYTVITGEQSGIDAQANAYGITTEKTTYDSAVTALTSYLGGLAGWNTIPGSDVTIVGTTFRQKFADVYTARQALLNKIAAQAKALADAAQGTANSASTAAANAQSAANAAASNASAALAQLASISSDSMLSKGEKPDAVRDWTVLDGERPGIVAQANAYGITTERDAYTAAIAALSSYLLGLSPPWADATQDTPIVQSTWLSQWSTAYQAKQALLNQIAAIAGTQATWSGTSGRPANVAALTGTEAINNALISVGGTNLWKNSTKAPALMSGTGSSALVSMTLPDGTTGNAIRITATTACVVRIYNAVRANGTHSISTYHKVGAAASWTVDICDANTSTISSTTAWSQYKKEGFTVSNYSLTIYNFIDLTIQAGMTLDLWRPKCEVGNKCTAWTPAPEDVDASVAAAQSAADNAATAAASALTELTAIGSDAVLSKVEKPEAIQKWNVIDTEKAGIVAQAASYGVSSTAYTTAVTTLQNYLIGLSPTWSDATQNTPIVASTWLTNWQNVYTTKQSLLVAIATEAGRRAEWVNTSGRPANVAALTGAESINNAQIALGTNQLFNADFALGVSGWAYSKSVGTIAIPTWGINLPDATWQLGGGSGGASTNTLAMNESGGAGGSGYTDVISPLVPAAPGDVMCISAWTGANRCNVQIFPYFYNSSGANIGHNAVGTATSLNNAEAQGGSTFAGFKRIFNAFTTPTNTAFVRLVIRKMQTLAGQTDSWLFACRAQVEQIGAAATGPGPWSAGVLNYTGDLDATKGAAFGVNITGQAQTSDIATNAATEVYQIFTQGPVSVTALSHVPDGYTWNTTVSSLSCRPNSGGSGNVDVVVTAAFQHSCTAGTSGGGVKSNFDLSIQWIQAAYDGYKRRSVAYLPASASVVSSGTLTAKFSVPSGQVATFSLMGNKYISDDSFQIQFIELKAEVIKR